MLEGRVTGREEIAHIKALLGIMPEELRKELGKNTRTALKPLEREIKETAVAFMPARHGYGDLLARTLKVSTRVSTTTAVSARVTISAKGKVENRDVRARNRGEMRHPTFGRRTAIVNGEVKSLWRVTRVKPGFIDEPVESARKRLLSAAEDARDKMADLLMRG